MNGFAPAPRIVVPDVINPEDLRRFDPDASVVCLRGETMGTTWQVLAAVPVALGLSSEQVRAIVQSRLDGIVRDMSHWDPHSQLCRFNRSPAGTEFALSEDLAAVMACALAVADASEGAFDPALGQLTDAWGLGPRPSAAVPKAGEIARRLHDSGWQRLIFDSEGRTLQQPGAVWLDLSGIAKGFAADAVADLMAQAGIFHVLVEIGGECTGRGIRPDDEPWWVDIENPPGVMFPPLRIALHQLAVATSGDYLRGGHTLDPRTGLPAVHQTTATTVIHRSCMWADAWATALAVLPRPEAMRLAVQHGLKARIVQRDGREWLSPALQAMM